jgi:predicted transcriptional regulator
MPVIKITQDKFRRAAKGTGGILMQIAKRLDCTREAVSRWVSKNGEYAQPILFHEREQILDMAEGSLFQQVQEKQAWATKYLLSTKGKERGYVEKQEIEHSEARPIKMVFDDVEHNGIEDKTDGEAKDRLGLSARQKDN